MIKMSYIAYCNIHRQITISEYISLLVGLDEWLEWQIYEVVNPKA